MELISIQIACLHPAGKPLRTHTTYFIVNSGIYQARSLFYLFIIRSLLTNWYQLLFFAGSLNTHLRIIWQFLIGLRILYGVHPAHGLHITKQDLRPW